VGKAHFPLAHRPRQLLKRLINYHSERVNDANVNPAKPGVNQLENRDTYLVQSGENLPSVPPSYVLDPIGPSSTLGYAHSTPVVVGVASIIVPDVAPVRPSLGATVGLELGSTSASVPSQNTDPTGDSLGTAVNPNVPGGIVATTDTKVGPTIVSGSAVNVGLANITFDPAANVGSVLTTSGSAANVGTLVTIPGFAANANPTVTVSGLAANVGPAITSGTTAAVSSSVTTVGISGIVSSSATNAGATTTTTATSSATTIPSTVIPAAAVGTAPVAPTVLVRQLQPVRPYNGSTPWKTFREQYRRVARVNGWVTTTDLVQYLTLALEGPAAEVLKDFDDSTETAYEYLWNRIEHRFGHHHHHHDAKTAEVRCDDSP